LDTSINNAGLKQSTIIWAVICSILLHILLVAVIPKLTFDAPKKIALPLKVELVQPKKPEPIPEKIEPIKPEPIKPAPIKPKEIKPKEIKPEPIKKAIEPKPEPKTEQVKAEPAPKVIPPEAKPEAAQAEPQVPKVIALEPKPAEAKPEEKPAFVAPTPQPEPARDEDVGAAKSAYKQSILKELRRNHRYPKMAERNGISGEVKVEIKFDDEGNVIATNIVESSGNSVLDDAALATVARSNLKQYMKKALVGHLDTLIVPIVFTLNNP
jgi:periplasmic protein TonB